IVFFHSGLEEREAALAFGYNRLTGIVSAGLRLISMGQQEGQRLLTKALDRLPDAVDRILGTKDEPLRSFNPLLDIEQMNHQHIYSRLFRSCLCGNELESASVGRSSRAKQRCAIASAKPCVTAFTLRL